jgi:hypothetical protein
MIKFALLCVHGHEFESWFQNGEAFETQSESGRVLCPLCQAADVTKAIMAPAVASKNVASKNEEERAKPLAQAEAGSGAETQSKVALFDSREVESRAMIRAFRRRIFEEAEDVGTRFAEEARKIHEGLVQERPIHGQANFDDARALLEEGIEILPVPRLPDELN